MSGVEINGRSLLAEVEVVESGGRGVSVNGSQRTTTAASDLPSTSTGWQ